MTTPDPNDTEGHGRRFPVEPADEDDTVTGTEGHGRRTPIEPADEDDTLSGIDTDGHGRFGYVEDAGADDAEGHRYVPRDERSGGRDLPGDPINTPGAVSGRPGRPTR